MKFNENQQRLYNALKQGDNLSIQEELWKKETFPMASGSGKSYAKCPLCDYTTNVTNIHRHCPLALLQPNTNFIFSGKGLSVQDKLYSLSMVEAPQNEQRQFNGYVPKGWNDFKWSKTITPKQWDEIISKQFFVESEKEYKDEL